MRLFCSSLSSSRKKLAFKTKKTTTTLFAVESSSMVQPNALCVMMLMSSTYIRYLSSPSHLLNTQCTICDNERGCCVFVAAEEKKADEEPSQITHSFVTANRHTLFSGKFFKWQSREREDNIHLHIQAMATDKNGQN